MGIFRNRSGRTPDESRDRTGPAETRAGCSCAEHLEQVARVRIPVVAEYAEEPGEDWSVDELVEAGALEARETESDERWLWADGQKVGPFQWSLWVGDEARSLYDDDAGLGLDDSLRSRPGLEIVEWEDREVFWLGAPSMCRSGVLAAAARALADPRVRRT